MDHTTQTLQTLQPAQPAQTDLPLSLQPFDPEIFQRVWDRVMPDQAASPIQVMPPAEHPAPARIPAPAQPACPEPPRPEADCLPLCLGEGARQYIPALEAAMEEARQALRASQALACRWSGPPRRLFQELSAQLQAGLRRLSAARFLISGEGYAPAGAALPLPGALPQALRALYRRGVCRAQSFAALAEGCGDPCLRELFLDLEAQGREQAARIRAFLEENPGLSK